MRKGFTLVELSIVLVILGLLAGGILAGQSLIHAAELRAVGTEYTRYKIAISAFKDKYFAVPGDMVNATAIWGKDATNCNGQSGTAATPGTCNGNGDGNIGTGNSAGQTGEEFQFWKQLQLAGLMEGMYSGIAGAASGVDSTFGANIPPSRLPSAGWSIAYLPNQAGSPVIYQYNYGNMFMFGAVPSGGGNTYIPTVLKAEEAWNIDTKIDDGAPGSGKVMVRSYNAWGASSCTTSTTYTDYNGAYNLSFTPRQCGFYFPQLF